MDDDANKHEPATVSATAGGSVTIDPQNPLPEKSFFWRRLFTIAITANAIVFAWVMAAWFHSANDLDKLYGLTKIVLYGDGFVLLFYFVAPSASEITNMVATASIWKTSIKSAADTAKSIVEQPESGRQDAKQPSGAADSQFVPPPPGAAPDAEIDAAPRSRS